MALREEMKKALRAVIKVALQDVAIVAGFLLVAPFVASAAASLHSSIQVMVLIVLLGIYFLILFFSNAELFKWIKNDYLWSLVTGSLTLLGFVIPSAMWVSHNNIYQVLRHAIT